MTNALRTLTICAGLVILLGGMLMLARFGRTTAGFHSFVGEPPALRFVAQIVSGAFHGSAPAIIQFGVLLLIATPVARVLAVGIGFALERDWLYVAVAAIVLAVLLWSLVKH